MLGAEAIFPDGSRVGRAYEQAPGYIVPRNRLDGMLRGVLVFLGGALIDGVPVRGLVRDESGRVRGVTDSERVWPAKAVIACDGFSSVALRSLGLEIQPGKHLGFGITCYFSGLEAGARPGISEHYFEPGLSSGYAWVFPAVEGLSNCGVYLRADELNRSGTGLHDLLKRFVEGHEARFSGARMDGRARIWPLPLATSPWEVTVPGLLMAGDAAYTIDPLSGEGIWQALHTGSLAGRAAADSLGAARGLDEERIREYQLQLRKDIYNPSERRRLIALVVSLVVKKELYRWKLVRAMLGWGYARGYSEFAKKVG